jgi:hypothetical protein
MAKFKKNNTICERAYQPKRQQISFVKLKSGDQRPLIKRGVFRKTYRVGAK